MIPLREPKYTNSRSLLKMAVKRVRQCGPISKGGFFIINKNAYISCDGNNCVFYGLKNCLTSFYFSCVHLFSH